MQKTLTKLVVKVLREACDKMEDGTCVLTADEQADIISAVTHRALNKGEACEFLNLSYSRFDDLVREGIIPRGRHKKHRKDLIWYEDELSNIVRKKK